MQNNETVKNILIKKEKILDIIFDINDKMDVFKRTEIEKIKTDIEPVILALDEDKLLQKSDSELQNILENITNGFNVLETIFAGEMK